MDDPLLPKKFTIHDYHVKRMMLSVEHWRELQLPQELQWDTPIRFHRDNLDAVPNTKSGVYSFVVKPKIASHPACSCMLYIGKTESPRQSLRKRLRQYFYYQQGKGRRHHITKMLRLWNGYLWVYYAPIEDRTKINEIELALIDAFLPPCNHDYEGRIEVAEQIKDLFDI